MKVSLALGFLVFLVAVVALATGPRTTAQRTGSDPVVIDMDQLDMLEVDQQMLDKMRLSVSPDMVTMIDGNPMWVDPDMIRLQEAYQADLDRMVGRRRGQP